jgi:hypothetical protein
MASEFSGLALEEVWVAVVAADTVKRPRHVESLDHPV